MNKTAIKSFAIWARNKLITDVSNDARLIGITEEGISNPLPQSFGDTQFFDIGTADPYSISGDAVRQRNKLVNALRQKEKDSDYRTAYQYVLEEVAYTWFNRLIAIRFMEVNDYLPSHIRVLSSDSGKMEPDLVTTPFDADLPFTEEEEKQIIELKQENKLDEVFRILFLKQCNALNEILPALFEKTKDYTELLLNLSVIDQDGVVYHLTHDIPEDDFNVEKGGQVEIIGWLYQYYNTEPKAAAFAKTGKITKDEIPAVTQLFTPDWIVRYMVENSLGRLWVEGHPDCDLQENWKYYLEEAEQTPDVQLQLAEIRKEYATLNPEDIKFIDPCMGSGHILVYAFDVLMQIYESVGYSRRDAAKSILEHNIYGLDIDDRAYQLAYFAVMMKARQYNRRILNGENTCRVYAIQESNSIKRKHLKYFGAGMADIEKNVAKMQLEGLLDALTDAKEYGSILNIESYNWDLLRVFVAANDTAGQISMDSVGLEDTAEQLNQLIDIGETMARKYDVVVANPPYMGNAGFSSKLAEHAKSNYANSKNDLYSIMIERCGQMTAPNCFAALITMQSWVNAPTFKNLRRHLFEKYVFDSIINMGSRAFEEITGEKVKNVAFVFSNRTKIKNWKPLFVDLTEVSGETAKKELFLTHEKLFDFTRQDDFLKHEQCLVIYKTRHVKDIYEPECKISDVSEVRRCIATGNDEAFIRTWVEVDKNSVSPIVEKDNASKWFFIAAGGERRRWYGNISNVLNWENSGKSLREFNNRTGKSTLRNIQYMFKDGITYTYTSMGSGIFNARQVLQGMASIGVGPVIVDCINTNYMMAFVNSVVFRWFWDTMYGKVSTFETGNVGRIAYKVMKENSIELRVNECIQEAKRDWDSFETSWDFKKHPLLRNTSTISEAFTQWQTECDDRFNRLKANEEELNRIFIDIYGLQDELTPEVEDKDVTVRKADLQRDIKSLLSYAVGCMFGRYSIYKDGLLFAGEQYSLQAFVDKLNDHPGTISIEELWRAYRNEGVVIDEMFFPDADNVIPITDEEYLNDDIVSRLCAWLKEVYGADTLEENLDYISKALGKKGSTSREIIRNYFLTDFFKDHCQTYSVTGSGKRPIYWLFDSGKQNGFKALIYLHRYTPDTIGNLRIDYLHKMQRVYESEINRMQDMMDHSENAREVAAASKRKEKLTKQLKECREYDEKISHLALSRIELDLDDGVKVNYRKLQTAQDGKFYEVLADSKKIMIKIKK